MDYKKAISDRFKPKSSSGSSATAIALALIGGAAVGALASLLLAPRSGGETRSMIRDKTRDLAGNLKDRLKWMKHNAESKAGALADTIKNDYKSAMDGRSSQG